MKKQYFVLVMASALLAVMGACAPMQPNPDTVQNGEGPAIETSVSSEEASPQEKENGSQPLSSVVTQETSSVLRTEYRGGIVSYQVESISLEESYEAAGVNSAQIVGQQELREGEAFLTITFLLENESLDPAILDGDYLVNNFFLVTQETVDAHQEGAVFNSPIYFDQAVDDEKRYFALEIPTIGESTNITLWCGIKKLTAYSQGFHNKTKRIRRYSKWHVNMTMNTKYRQ